jgi:hypothetical protein
MKIFCTSDHNFFQILSLLVTSIPRCFGDLINSSLEWSEKFCAEKVNKNLPKFSTHFISLISFSSLCPVKKLNSYIDHLIKHISKSVVKIETVFDFHESSYVLGIPKFILEFSILFQWTIHAALKIPIERYRKTALSMIGALMAIEDISLLSHLYKGLNYDDIIKPISDSHFALLEKIINQESSDMKLLKAKNESFVDIITHKKCNFRDCEFEAVCPSQQNTEVDRSYYIVVIDIMYFMCNLMYFYS